MDWWYANTWAMILYISRHYVPKCSTNITVTFSPPISISIFHRSSFFSVPITDHRSKAKNIYLYEKFTLLPTAEEYLRLGINSDKLDDLAGEMSDHEFAERVARAYSNLFQNISRWVERVDRGSPSPVPITAQAKQKGSQVNRNRITSSP